MLHCSETANLALATGLCSRTHMGQDCLDALHSGQGRAKHVLPWHAPEVGRPGDDVGQLSRLAAWEVVLLENGVGTQNVAGAAGNEACCLFCCLL